MLNPFKIWRKIPEQLRRLGVVIVSVFVVVVFLRNQFVPEDFGKLGHYRYSALEREKKKEMTYAGRERCEECHDEERNMLSSSYHKNLSCETCHGPGLKHAESEGEVEVIIPSRREDCLRCHAYLVSRPTGFPQVEQMLHNPPKQCITCHNPHDPTPPHPPSSCQVCHRTIARMKAVSPHTSLECTICHRAPSKHRLDPRAYRPSKPAKREFCGQCHSETARSPSYIPRINIEHHGEGYVCWECHYPHYPEGG